MTLVACGVNHKTAPLSIRERLAFGVECVPESLRDLVESVDTSEVAILSTCNRTELYGHLDNWDGRKDALVSWLSEHRQFPYDELNRYIYSYQEEEALRHMLRVASGLDSMALGEPQIFGQMKTAFAVAKDTGTIGPKLQRLFQHIFSTTKQIRTQTGIGANPVSIVYTAIHLTKHIFSDITKNSALVIGAGETIELALRYLRGKKVKEILVANRSLPKAEQLAAKYGSKAIPFPEITHYLHFADIIISATSSQLPILGKGCIESALKRRKRRPMFIVDLAVPRDVEPEVADISDIYLYNIDDLQQVIDDNLKNRQFAIEQAEAIIELQVQHYIQQLKSLTSVQTIRNYRAKIEGIRDQQVAKALQMLRSGYPAEEVVCEMARTLTNKIMHTPVVQMKRASFEGCLEILDSAKLLFDLEDI